MAKLTIDLLSLIIKLHGKATPQEIYQAIRKFEKRLATWGRQFEGSTFHERKRWEASIFTPSNLKLTKRILEMDNIPDDAIVRFFKEVFPELEGQIKALPERIGPDSYYATSRPLEGEDDE